MHARLSRKLVLILAVGGTTVTTALAAPLSDPIPSSPPSVALRVQLQTVATGLNAPNSGVAAPGDAADLFVTDQNGVLWAIDLASGNKRVFLDLRDQVLSSGERGLLGVAFHPDFVDNGLLYTYTSEATDSAADFPVPADGAPDHQGVIREWRGADPDSTRVLLRVAEPQANHNGGALAFGPDKMLYIAWGDGGSADDRGSGHSPEGNGQDTGNVLGTILRIDPLGSNAANGQYGVPQDNPFVAQNDSAPFGGESGCADGVCDEIFAYGLRNPFRLSFDRERGDLYVGDVGQNAIEEVDVVTSGGNYGWPLKEGSFCFDPNGGDPGFVTDDADCGQDGLLDPVAEYDHDEGSAVIGGFVYRGRRLPGLRGRYVFGDFSRQGEGRLFFLIRKNIVRENGIQPSRIIELRLTDQDGLGMQLLGFGQDTDGELYALGRTPTGDGVVRKLVRASGR
ncbi:MAG: PQQ-dependent sugar dehydrogenase [Gammaproteobacteria bacterium]|nr:PQQ-dependent sugar dehydrogenase [Gammaproteobacteria bacterium]